MLWHVVRVVCEHSHNTLWCGWCVNIHTTHYGVGGVLWYCARVMCSEWYVVVHCVSVVCGGTM